MSLRDLKTQMRGYYDGIKENEMRIDMNVTFGFEEMWHMLFLQDSFDAADKRMKRYSDIVSDEGLPVEPSVDQVEWKARMEQGLSWARQMDRRIFAAVHDGELCRLLARYEDMTDLRDFTQRSLGENFEVVDWDQDQTVLALINHCECQDVEESLRIIYNRGIDPDPDSKDEQERSDAKLLDYLRGIRARHQAALPAFEKATVPDLSLLSPTEPPYVNIGTSNDASAQNASAPSDTDPDDPFSDA
jgi:hypothetical protein